MELLKPTLPSKTWSEIMDREWEKPYFQKLLASVEAQYAETTVYPPQSAIFNALRYTSYKATKVVILGQDPYHGPGQAHGLSFSVLPGVQKPPSLQNMFKELRDDLGCTVPDHGCLITWAEQGVLLLNTVLTVTDGLPASHKKRGWEKFTDVVISSLSERKEPLVFVLWGKHAQAKTALIHTDRHTIIATPHPSPLSARRGFFGSKPFSKINAYLRQFGVAEIDWQIPQLAELEAAATNER